MDIRKLGRLDLNLLVALEALIEERSVSRAAQRLYITQSAMSKTLGRLRELFDDPLFVRKGSGMVPTPRAEQLARQLPAVLLAVQDMVAPATFDPLTFSGQFSLLVQGHMGVWLVPRLISRLVEQAPHVRLSVMTRLEDPLEQLDNGKLDFVLQAGLHEYPADLRITPLGYASPLLLARKGHPLEGKSLVWDDLMGYRHVQLAAAELADIQFFTADTSTLVHRITALEPDLLTDQLLTVMQVLRETDYLFPAPPLFLEHADLGKDLIALPLPEVENVSLAYVMVNHERVNESAPHAFLYNEILAVMHSIEMDYGFPRATGETP